MSNEYDSKQAQKPFKAYIKRTMGKLYVNILNPFTGKEDGLILVGDPRKENPESILEVWSEKEDSFFKRYNRKHLESGNIVEYNYREPEISEAEKLNSLSDEELSKILNSRFFALSEYMKKVTSVAPLSALLELAEEQEKSEKITNAIKARLEELQRAEFEVKKETKEQLETQ